MPVASLYTRKCLSPLITARMYTPAHTFPFELYCVLATAYESSYGFFFFFGFFCGG